MGHWRHSILLLVVFTACFYCSHGCQMESITNWALPQTLNVLDTFRGNVVDRSTSDIEGITNISFGGGLNSGPYLDIIFADSRFVIATNNAYENYEENETAQLIPVTITFRCSSGSNGILNFRITVVDTNNNAPQFIPSNEFVYTVAPPLPPGYEITGCFNDLTVRDIDLTTQRIEFAILDSSLFEIEYDAASSTTAKEFKAILRTTTFIRAVPEPIRFTITATDVDLTGDPQRTTSASVTINGNTDFELPDEPVFSETFYHATYTDDNQLVLTEPITLRSGYDDLVQFTIEGDFRNYFELVQVGNQITFRVVNSLGADILSEKQIFLVVRADREHTSGASATVIVQLPEEVLLAFERSHYEGTIENNNLQVPQLFLIQGYEGASVTAVVLNEYSSYFSAMVQANQVILSMSPLDENVINENSFINLQVVASTDRSTATAIVTLEIIKDDNITPVFSRAIYAGSHNPESGLTLEQIELVQGYDDPISVVLVGEHAGFFETNLNGSIVTLNALDIPPEIYSEGRILMYLQASKPRTVGATAAVSITLPAARELEFEASTYRGTLQDNELSLEPILLTVGYDENVEFFLTGDYESYFSVSNLQSRVTISLTTPIPNNIILENNNVVLILTASGLNAVTTTTNVVLDIVKDDITTPVFTRNIYYGTYLGPSNINIENINLMQGFDDGVTFRLDGDHAQYFELTNNENNVVLSLRSSIPEEVIFNEKVLSFNVLAEKALTVGGNAAILIKFPSDLTDSAVMRFTQNTYTGTLENNAVTVETIILSSGYAAGTDFILTGGYSAYFTLTNNNNEVFLSLSPLNPLPSDILDNTLIVLEIEARRERAVSVWTSVVIEIKKQEIVSPIFTEPIYRGVYKAESGLQFDEVISLLSGYDETVTFLLDGEFSSLFSIVRWGENSLSIEPRAPIPDEILKDNSYFLITILASKPEAVTAQATIFIDIEKEFRALQFSQDYYTGSIEGSSLTLGVMNLEGYSDDVAYALTGDYKDYFQLENRDGVFTLYLLNVLPVEVTEANDILIFTIEAQIENTRTHTTIILEIVKDRETEINLAFEEIYYVGSYSEEVGLLFDAEIRLTEDINSQVTYTLDGDQGQWFGLNQIGNSIELTVTSEIPSIVLQNNQQLIFTIRANSPGFTTATATIVITIIKGDANVMLGFDQINYIGSIRNNATDIVPITLIDGYTDEVVFALHGDLSNYFTLTRQAAVVNVAIQTPIPAQLIPVNRIIVLQIQASAPPAATTYATIVFNVIMEEDDSSSTTQLAFDAPFYTGSYNTVDGLVVDTPITLSEGYDDSVQFALDGENSQWFSLVRDQNSVTLVVSSGIPSGVLTNNRQLVFVVTAQKSGSITARSTIVISLTDEYTEGSNLGFDRVTYLGSIQNNATDIGPMTLIEGYTDDVMFTLYGDLSNYFTLTRQAAVVNVAIQTPIPAQLIPVNRIIVLQIQASAPPAVTTYSTIVFNVIMEEDDSSSTTQLAFDAPFYTGSYNTVDGLVVNTPITLSEGYDDSVQFALDGENSQWFSLVRDQNSVTLVVSSGIPSGVLTNNRQLVFVVTAQKSGSITARSTIVISLTDEYTEGSNLGFDRVTYLGSIQNNATDIGPMTLIEGYTDDVTFTLYGDLSNYFTLTRQAAVVNVAIQTPIPAQLIPVNRIIVLQIQASAPPAVTTYATIVFNVIMEEDDSSSTTQLAFDAPFYTGSYNTVDGLDVDTPITLSEGYDDSVQFALDGENSQWFSLVRDQNSVTLVVSSGIPSGVLTNNRHLVFVVTAQKSGSVTARSTIVISLTDEYTEGSNLGFDRVTYLGSIQNNATDIVPMTLIEGYTDDVTFTLYGDLSNYFTLTRQAAVVNVAIQTPIPAQLIPVNRIIVLQIQASAPPAVTTYATIVFNVIMEEDDSSSTTQLAFDAPFYTGSYNTVDGLVVDTPITLSEGYDDSVQFALDGENSQWFSLVRDQNSVTLVVSSGIPSGVLTNNRQLVFVVTAQKSGSITARSTIVISLTDEYTEGSNLGFDRVTYLGSIQNNATDIGPMTLIEGYTDDVTFTLYGDLSNYFTLTRQAAVVNVAIQTPIPAQLIPVNRIIVLQIQASAPPAVTTYATIVFNVIMEEDDSSTTTQLAFDAPFYTGSYNTVDGLVVDTPITLSEGYDDSVQFALDGENSQWFSLVRDQNSVTLVVSSGIPSGVLTNNRHLVFVVTAQKSGSVTARSTIVISLTDEYTEGSNLGFDRVTYLGSIQNNATDIVPMTLIEGYTDDVTFTLYGDLSNYFTLTRQAAVVNVAIQTPIPAQLIPVNRIIVLQIQASAPPAVTTYATIVFNVIMEEDDSSSTTQLAFDAPFYTGSYNTVDGLVVDTPITLSEGYDDSVQFALDGENSQWFSLVRDQNSVTLVVSSGIPSGVLTNNRQLVFVVTAQKSGSITARSTIVISLTDEYTEGSNLGFDRVTYLGSIQNNATDIGPMTLIEGYTDDVTFTLYGDLSNYFTLTRQAAVVNVAIQTPIPPQLIPVNRIIVLQIQASAPPAVTTYATIVFNVIMEEDDSSSTTQLAFDAPFYTGSYNTVDGLVVDTPITLSEGYDDSVQFALDGENSQWFSLVRDQNSVTLVVSSGIPSGVLTNNRQLVFVVTAQKSGSITARSTIVISLTDEYTEGSNLGFDRVTYLGSIQNNATDIGPMTLIEGYTDDVTFTLYGDLSNYFTLTRQAAVVNVAIQTPIPTQLIPVNRIIVLQIQASAPPAATTYATIVFNVIMEEDDSSSTTQLAFDAPFYTGSYNTVNGLVVDTPITLSEGYDDSVQFALDGENSQWFSLVRDQNSVTLVVSSGIPSGVLTNNRQLVFVVTAQKSGSITARSTIVISLTDEYTEGSNLGFDRVTYLGSIQNNATDIGPMTLIEGYTDDVTFTLYGDLSNYFTLTRQAAVVNVAIQTPIPTQLIPVNRIIVLQIQASAPPAATTYATIVFNVIMEEDDSFSTTQLAFDAPFYTGSYNTVNGLVVDTPITLSEGYDDSVQFALDGENSQWFSLVRDQNSVTLVVSSGIPSGVLTNNRQLVFVVTAQKSGSITARSTIVISLTDEYTEGSNLGFDRVTYLGSIQNNATDIGPMTLIEGYTDDVTFTLYGDLSDYFTLTRQAAVVNVAIQTPIPAQLIPVNRIIVLQIQASAPPAVTTYATIVFNVIMEEDDSSSTTQLAFDAPFYTGSYNTVDGLVVDTPITLSEGYDDSVQFALDGENSQWFSLVRDQNSVTLVVSSGIPSGVLTNNRQLVFVVTAQKSGSITARSTIVISLTDEYTEGSNLGFDRVTYLGSIQNNATDIGPMTLIEGYTDDVTFTLYGDLSNYFTLTRQAAVVNVAIQTPIPAQLIPVNRIIVLQIQASAPPAVTTYATIVFNVIMEEDDSSSTTQLAFDAPFYTGSYNTVDGLVVDTPITLSEGYDDSVQFALDGENSQWFSLVRDQNSVTLVVSSGIPSGVLTNNRQLVFVVTAQKSGSITARSTIVISLTDEYTEGSNLGFDRVTYLGSIQNNATDIGPMTLIEGYTDDVTFTLYGDLSNYFTLTRQAAVVNVAIQTPIPAQLIPVNRIIVLQIQASAPPAVTTYATIVFNVIMEEDDSSLTAQLAFDAPFYTGSYNTVDGLVVDTPITLSEGYDDSVQFALDGENSQWFSLVRDQNSVTLVVSSGIPSGVLTNNRQLVFVVTAQKSGSITARSTIVISLTDEYTEGSNLGFDRVTYLGSIQNNATDIGPMTLIEGYTDDVTFTLYGDLSNYFTLTRQAAVVNVAIHTPIPTQLIPVNRIIVLQIQASAPPAATTYATIVFNVIMEEDDSSSTTQLAFDAPFYTGSYNTVNGLVVDTPITLSEGYDDSVQFALDGENSQWFSLVRDQNSVTLVVSSGIPSGVLTNNRQLVFVVTAQKSGSITARSTIVISLTDEYTEGSNLGFDRVTYLGSIQNNATDIGPMTLIEGYTDDVTFTLYGDLSNYFTLTRQAAVVNVAIQTPIPTQLIPVNRIIVLQIQASAPPAATTYATIVFNVIMEEDDSFSTTQLAFDAPFYTGSYNTVNGLVVDTPITLSEGYDDSVQFALDGENSQWFSLVRDQNSVTLVVSSGIPSGVLTNNRQLVFVVTAQKSGSITARSTIVISLTDEYTEGSNLGFDRVTYLGSIQNNATDIGPMTLIEGYTYDVTFTLYGDLSNYFTLTRQAAVVNVAIQTPIPAQLIPVNRIIVLQIQASAPPAVTTYATIVFNVIMEEDDSSSATQLAFDAPFYTGSYNTVDGLVVDTPITLSEGYDDSVQFALDGENSQWFSLVREQNYVTLVVASGIPSGVLTNNRQLIFVITAQRAGSVTARSTIVISLSDNELQIGDDIAFEKVLYEGIIQLNEVQHETITITGYDGANIILIGEYSSLFVARVTDGMVTVEASGSVTLPADVTQVALELHAADARAVLLLAVLQSDVPVFPSVTFGSGSYILNVEIAQTGLVGRVSATADNGEAVTYSVATDNAHLQARLSINNEGELYLSAPANSGVYTFQVIATTVITQASGTATVHLTVEAITVCGENDIVVPPLIILDRDEEEPHNNLVVLNSTQYNGCFFSLTNRWPVDQTWLYVDGQGLHATAIDREHPSIAFMALSQVQVELVLHCETDNAIRTKRSERTDWLGPYDYGTNKWILTDTIPYNSRRSFVNLIVNDINDNAPIFVGKEHEPIAVGYPIDELEERILPRSLAELQATDADVGENAALRYWSSESELAVAPSTGFVHVRSGARLQHDQTLTVNATDRNGEGLTGSIQLVVKLLNLNNIAVVTVRDAFLDDEKDILSQLNDAVGYEVKTLRSVVISDDIDEDITRKKRETDTKGASLQLYVYGLIEREAVSVERLAADINNNAAIVSVISTVSLEDHLEDSEINNLERDIGLLVATIVLSILLFLLLLLIAIWFFLRWRKNRNYDSFSDENSIASRNGSLGELPKPEVSKPRLNIEDLKRSERRLQEMLNAPIEEVTVEPIASKKETPIESILDLPTPEPHVPIVIQSIDKLKDAEDSEDEFGEKNDVRRKSVVTFNENVEKIIHVEDDTDSIQSDYEIYRF